MKTSLLFQFLLLLLIVLVNIQPPLLPVKISPLPATIALAILVLVHTYINLKSITNSHIVPADIDENNGIIDGEDKKESDTMSEETRTVNSIKSLSDLIDAARTTSSNEEALQQLQLEYDIYRQCYIWVDNMDKIYGKQWRDTIQGADMPVNAELFPEIHRLVTEVAMHTIDFCRYRTNYINLTPLMKVNPTMILLNKDAQQAGAKLYSEDPFETEREVRVLHTLIRHDGVKLQNATIHGYFERLTEEVK